MPLGSASWYDLIAGRIVDMEDVVHLITPVESPFLGTYNNDVGIPYGPEKSVLPKEDMAQVKWEWQEEELNISESKVDNNPLAAGGLTLNVPAGDGVRFQKGHVLRMEKELVRVTAVVTDALTITRAFAGTADVAHAQGVKVYAIGTALPEGSDPETHRFRDRTKLHNFSQIFGPYETKITGTKQVTPTYGVPKEFSHQLRNRVWEMVREIERAIPYGMRSDDETNEFRTMGGFVFYILTNLDSTTTDLIAPKLLDQYQNCFNNGGSPELIACGGTQKRKLSGFNDAQINLDRVDRARGSVVTRFENDFAVSDILLNRYIETPDLFILSLSDIALGTLRTIRTEPLAKTGDSDKVQSLCEKSLKVRMEKRHARFNALA